MSINDYISFDMWSDYDPDFREEPTFLPRCTVMRMTAKAVHVKQPVPGPHPGFRQAWIPLSQIEKSWMTEPLEVGRTLEIPITLWMEKKMFGKWEPLKEQYDEGQ